MSSEGNIPPIITSRRGKLSIQILFRVLIALGVWLVVSGLSLRVAWNSVPDSLAAGGGQFWTKRQLEEIAQVIHEFHLKSTSDPKSMDDLLPVLTNNFPVFGAEKAVVDGWQRPFIFSFDGTNCLVISYGRDGLPGGKGLDCDLTSTNWNPKEARPTFHQFFYDMPTRGMVNSCLACGGIAAFLALYTVRIPDNGIRGLLALGIKLGATILGALIAAIIISAAHVPSGH